TSRRSASRFASVGAAGAAPGLACASASSRRCCFSCVSAAPFAPPSPSAGPSCLLVTLNARRSPAPGFAGSFGGATAPPRCRGRRGRRPRRLRLDRHCACGGVALPLGERLVGQLVPPLFLDAMLLDLLPGLLPGLLCAAAFDATAVGAALQRFHPRRQVAPAA